MPIHTDMPAAEYHADPAPEPSLSSSVARLLVERSPLHAWWAHPRLNPEWEPEDETKAHTNLGSAAHAVALEGGWERIEWVAAPDWRTKAAKEERYIALSSGKIPLLEKNRPQVEGMVSRLEPLLPSPRQSEVTLIWQEPNGAWCRARIDVMQTALLAGQSALIADVKTTTMAATPEGWGRRAMWDYCMQCGLYRRGYAATHNCAPPAWRFIVQEQAAPYCAATFTFDNESLAYCDALALQAIDIWGECMASGEWPGYPAGGHVAEMPAWMRARGRNERNRQQPDRAVLGLSAPDAAGWPRVRLHVRPSEGATGGLCERETCCATGSIRTEGRFMRTARPAQGAGSMTSMWTAPCDPADEGCPWDPRESDEDRCRDESECLLLMEGGGVCRTETECAGRRERWAVEKAMEDSE